MAERMQFRVKAIIRENGSAMYKATITAASPAAALGRIASRLGLGQSEAFPPSLVMSVQPVGRRTGR